MSVFVFVESTMQDYDAWKVVFDDNQAFREQHGAVRHWLYRAPTDANDVFVAIEFPTLEQAQAFSADPALAEAMKAAGVTGPPRISYREETEVIDY